MSVTFSVDNTTDAYKLSIRDAYRVLNYLGMPITDYGVNHSLPAPEFSRRIRGAWQLNVMCPLPGEEELTERLRELVRLASQAGQGSVSWHL